MITLKEALNLPKEEIKELKKDINRLAKEKKDLGGYIEQFLDRDLSELGDGVPVAIKDNINVKGWEITCSSKILQGYVSPYNATVIEKMLNIDSIDMVLLPTIHDSSIILFLASTMCG